MLLKNKYYMAIVLLLLVIATIIAFNESWIANPVFERIFYILLSIILSWYFLEHLLYIRRNKMKSSEGSGVLWTSS